MPNHARVLVTGASGFIAKHIVAQLLEAGHDVVGSVRSDGRIAEIRTAVSNNVASADDLDARLRFVSLDLGKDDGWDAAMAGVDAVIHTASPFPLVQPNDEDDVIRPAVDGTRRALRAANAAGVHRIVLTSSTAAVVYGALRAGRDTYDEDDWTDLSLPTATPYVKSKTLAERAAWAFVETEAPDIQLTSINPGFVVGAPLDDSYGTSLRVVERLLKGKDPMLPNFGFPAVHVADVARMHVAALNNPQSVGKRIIGAERFVWFSEMAQTLKTAYPERKIPTRTAPDFFVRFLSLFDKSIKTIVPNLGRREEIDNTRAREVLAVRFTPAIDGVHAAARYLIERGLV